MYSSSGLDVMNGHVLDLGPQLGLIDDDPTGVTEHLCARQNFYKAVPREQRDEYNLMPNIIIWEWVDSLVVADETKTKSYCSRSR
jgi:hypothetical protein